MTDLEDVMMTEASDVVAVMTKVASVADKMTMPQGAEMMTDLGVGMTKQIIGEANHGQNSNIHLIVAAVIATNVGHAVGTDPGALTMKEDEQTMNHLGGVPHLLRRTRINLVVDLVTDQIAVWIAGMTVVAGAGKEDRHVATEMTVAAVLATAKAVAAVAGVIVLGAVAAKIVMKEDHREETTETGEVAEVMTQATGVG